MNKSKKVYKIMIDNENGASSIEEDELLTDLIAQIEDLTQDVNYLVDLIENKYEKHFVKF